MKRSRYGAGLSALLAVLLLAGCLKQSIDDEDLPLLITASDLAAYGLAPPDPTQHERFRRNVYFDFSKEIEYEYEAPDDTDADLRYLSVTVEFERTAGDARATYTLGRAALSVGTRIGGAEIVEDIDFFRWGDESFFGFLEYEGTPVGNLFTTRKGSKIYTVMLSGVYFDDVDLWRELVVPRLEYMEAYDP